MDARKPHLLHLGSFVSWERMHLALAFAQGPHAEPHPADHFIFRQECAKSTSENNKTCTGPIRRMRRDEKEVIGNFKHSSILLRTQDDVAKLEVTTPRLRHGLSHNLSTLRNFRGVLAGKLTGAPTEIPLRIRYM